MKPTAAPFSPRASNFTGPCTLFSVDNAKIISYLHGGVTLNSVQGPVKFDALGENGAAVGFIFQWQKNGTAYEQVLPQGASGSVTIINPKTPWSS